MPLVVLLGGVRSGKSRLAVSLAERAGAPVAFVATGQARDGEMEARIARHRDERPAGWSTLEEPIDVAGALASVDEATTAIVDCVSIWVANLLEAGLAEPAVQRVCGDAIERASTRTGLTLVVSNEVGMGIVPATPLGRAFRDLLGGVNRRWVEASDRAALVVAGQLVHLDPVDPLLAWVTP